MKTAMMKKESKAHLPQTSSKDCWRSGLGISRKWRLLITKNLLLPRKEVRRWKRKG